MPMASNSHRPPLTEQERLEKQRLLAAYKTAKAEWRERGEKLTDQKLGQIVAEAIERPEPYSQGAVWQFTSLKSDTRPPDDFIIGFSLALEIDAGTISDRLVKQAGHYLVASHIKPYNDGVAELGGDYLELPAFLRRGTPAGTPLALSDFDATLHQETDNPLRRVPVLNPEEIISGRLNSDRKDDQTCPAVDVGPSAFAMQAANIPNPNDRYGIDPGAYIIIDPDQAPINGRPVLVKDSNQQLIIRRYEIVGSKRYLAAYNERYEPIEMDDSFTLIGRVTGSHNVF